MSLTKRERASLVNDLRLFDQMEAEALAEIKLLTERGGEHCARSAAFTLIGDNALADFHHTMGWKLLDDARQKLVALAEFRGEMEMTEAELAVKGGEA